MAASRRAPSPLARLHSYRLLGQKEPMAFWVYMLQCADQSYYIGHTNDVEKRILEHQTGERDGYTARRRPVRVVFTQEFPSREEALAAELQIKGWSRKKKEALVRGDWAEISRLAKRRQTFRPP